MKPIKIETLLIRNFKRVNLAEVEFGENGATIIGGGNCQGKSTFLDAIKYLLGGNKYSPTQPHNLDAGGATAVVRSTLSNGVEVERSGKNSALKVKVDGKKGNQATLKEFLNEFALDIDKFMRSSSTEKMKMLIEHLGIGEQLELLDKKIKHCCEERTVVGRDAERKKALADAMVTHDNAPSSRVDVTELIKQERVLAEANRQHEEKLSSLNQIKESGLRKMDEIRELEQKLETARAEAKAMRAEFDSLKSETDNFTPHDLSEITNQIENAESLNGMFEANEKAKASQEESKVAKKEYQTLTDTINESREQRQALIAKMDMPLSGLTLSDGELLFNGQQWDCMSGSERLKVATAISRAFKPECGFVLIDELEQMDWKTINDFDAWAKEQGIQIIGAMVCDEDKQAENVIIIEDGRVKENV